MPTVHTISEGLRDSFITLIAQRTGIEIRTQNYSTMGDNILSRVKTLNLASPVDYLNLLSQTSEAADQEWQNFVCLLTNRESYFFRDKGQMSLLKQRILPEIIRANLRTKTIRICSAGCSTGQEPYSIAILLTELLPDAAEWQLKIMGIDINRESLDQGKRAMYNPWSFRQVEDHIKEQYFKSLGGYYKLNPNIQRLVRFQQVNLVRDNFHDVNPDTQSLDLIICRNVFIYFTDQAISTVMDKFHQVLKPNGYLMAGHAELQNHHVKAFKGHMFTESLVYTKQGHSINLVGTAPKARPQTAGQVAGLTPSKSPATPPEPFKLTLKPLPKPTTVHQFAASAPKADSKLSPLVVDLSDVKTLVQQKSYTLALKKLETLHQQNPRHFQVCLLLAEVQANLGNHAQAREWCEKAIALDNFQLAPHYLLAKIAEEKNEIELAKQTLKRIIYLDDQAVPAYFYLANLYQSQGDLQRCHKLQTSAVKILQKIPPDNRFSELDNITAEDLIKQFSLTA
ncbi:MAG: CheR family methyltransferase [Synechocystis sp.]|nr:CheR family methyltransferase [Synechocystis sp.]